MIYVSATLKNKLDAGFRPYVILVVCSPAFTYEALKKEKDIGTLLPCNVIMQESEKGEIEISTVAPVASK